MGLVYNWVTDTGPAAVGVMSLLHFYSSQSPQTRPSLTGAVRQLGHLIFLCGNAVSVYARVPQSVYFGHHYSQWWGKGTDVGVHVVCSLSLFLSILQDNLYTPWEKERERQLMREFYQAYSQWKHYPVSGRCSHKRKHNSNKKLTFQLMANCFCWELKGNSHNLSSSKPTCVTRLL